MSKIPIDLYYNPDLDCFTLEVGIAAINIDYSREGNEIIIKVPPIVSKIFTEEGKKWLEEELIDLAKRKIAYPMEKIVVVFE